MNIIHWPFGKENPPLNGTFLMVAVFCLSVIGGLGFHIGWLAAGK